jgi:hypothetical protein
MNSRAKVKVIKVDWIKAEGRRRIVNQTAHWRQFSAQHVEIEIIVLNEDGRELNALYVDGDTSPKSKLAP